MDTTIISFIGGLTLGAIITKILLSKADDSKFIQNRISDLETQNTDLNTEVSQNNADLAVAREQIRSMQRQMSDWEKTKQEFINNSKMASLEATQKITNQILEKHENLSKRTAEETEKRIEKSTKELHESYKDLFSSVGHLKETLSSNTSTVETIKLAISSSANVGYASETVLENTLSAFGLIKEHDFFTQMSVDGENGKLRPDAVVFLPDNNALVIDSKSSQFIYQLAEAEHSGNEVEIEIAYKNLKSSMSKHLDSLTTKDYGKAIRQEMKKMGKENSLNNITVIMWLPNDGAVEKVLKADPTFSKRAGISNVFICGPTGLWTAVGMASQKIRLESQSKNQQKIIEEAEKLLNSIATVVSHGKKVTNGLQSATKAWEKFTASFDSRFISTARRINKLGVDTNKEINSLGANGLSDVLEIENTSQNAIDNQPDKV